MHIVRHTNELIQKSGHKLVFKKTQKLVSNKKSATVTILQQKADNIKIITYGWEQQLATQ
jgi:hypothetical protein